MADLAYHRAYLGGAWADAQAHPLSRRKAMLVAFLIDALADHCFAADPQAEDILAYRTALATRSEALGWVMALCAGRSVQLVIETVAVPLERYGALDVADFMVSLYNDQTIQRLRLVLADGSRRDMLDVLDRAIAALS